MKTSPSFSMKTILSPGSRSSLNLTILGMVICDFLLSFAMSNIVSLLSMFVKFVKKTLNTLLFVKKVKKVKK